MLILTIYEYFAGFKVKLTLEINLAYSPVALLWEVYGTILGVK
jgi:hypothetical protein